MKERRRERRRGEEGFHEGHSESENMSSQAAPSEPHRVRQFYFNQISLSTFLSEGENGVLADVIKVSV